MTSRILLGWVALSIPVSLLTGRRLSAVRAALPLPVSPSGHGRPAPAGAAAGPGGGPSSS